MERILLDTDIGGDIDDAICLAYLLCEPQCELLGITTVCGESEKRASVADAICQAAGKTIPIAAGLDTTLQPVPVYPTPEGAGALAHWPHHTYEKADAAAFLYQKIQENPHEVVLIAIGNMTNIATLFRSYPEAPGLLKGLFVMNGYFGAEPLPEPYYNWNSWADPLASSIVFAAQTATHRAIPLEVTDMLTIEAKRAGTLLGADSKLMRAVFGFGNAWLESAGKLTLHDPLVAVSVFHPELCRFERGTVRVETGLENDMGGTAFTTDPNGNVEVARTVDRERFYHILSTVLGCRASTCRREDLPPLVVSRAKSVGAVGEAWLGNLDNMIAGLEAQWNISVGKPLAGGTHAYVAYADGQGGEAYVLKIDMPENLGGTFSNSMAALRIADGRGCAKLFACDAEKKACLLERLGRPISTLPYTIDEQLRIICDVLQVLWETPAQDAGLTDGKESVAWFRAFIQDTWEALHRPCSRRVIRQALLYLQSREDAMNPAEWVLLHGDAHGNNTLQAASAANRFKLIDPDGLFYEKAYDLGVLMREWIDAYQPNPMRKARERCDYLHSLTGVAKEAIWAWGFLQTVSTAFVLLQIGQEEIGRKMLDTAESWSASLQKEQSALGRP